MTRTKEATWTLLARGAQKGKGKWGKAKGKGQFSRQFYTCGEIGHMAYECPKGTGKGKPPLTCWSCGNQGHPYWMCPAIRVNRKGKKWSRSTAKGTYGVEADWPTWQEARSDPTQE